MVIRVLKSAPSGQSVVNNIFVSFVQFVFIKSLLQHLNTTLPQ